MNPKSELVAVVKPGCPACEETKPALVRAKPIIKKKVRFAEIDVDKDPEAVERYQIQEFPAFVYTNSSGTRHYMPWQGVPRAQEIVHWIDDIRGGRSTIGLVPTPRNTNAKCDKCGTNGGVSPAVWGPPLWFVIHMVALMYSQRPTPAERNDMKQFFVGLQKVLPCSYCQKHFAKELATMSPHVFHSRDTLFDWTVRFHDSVSDRTHSTQPRHSVNYWRKYYKRAVLRVTGHKHRA